MADRFLLIIDVQAGFINRWTQEIPHVVTALQDDFERVVATRFVNPEGSMHRRLIGWERFSPGSNEVELAFPPRPDARIMDKTTYSAATPDVLAALRKSGIDAVYLAGIATDGCVLKTAVDLFEAGIRPIVLIDACQSHGGPDAHAAGLLLLKRFIGEKQLVDRN